MSINRRHMLRGVGAACALPCFESLAAAKSANDKCLVYVYFPNGSAEGTWAPTADSQGRIRALNPEMAALTPYRSKLAIPANIWTPAGNGHGAGTATWLTGGEYDGKRVDAGGASVDQIAAAQLGQQSLWPTLQMALKGQGNFARDLPRNNISWLRADLPAGSETEPRAIFDRMFRGGRDNWARQSVLDLVSEQARDLQRRLGQDDKRKLDEYLSSIRSVERRIEFAETGTRRTRMARPESGIPRDHEAYMRLMIDLGVLALWTGATPVLTFMMDHGQSNRYFDFIDGVKGTWHALSHYKDFSGKTEDDDGVTTWSSRASKRSMYNAVTRWHHEQFAYMLSRMNALRDERGSLLDRSLVLYGSSIADGHEHAEQNLPLLVAGGCGLRTGRYLKLRRTSMSKLHLSMLRAVGVPATRFAETRSELSELIG